MIGESKQTKEKTAAKKKGNAKERNKQTNKQTNKKQPSSLPSLRERSETQGALDRRVHWESQETPVAQSHLSASDRITGYHTGVLTVGGVVENRFCTRGQNPRLDYWGGNIQLDRLNFPPKPCSNSIITPQPGRLKSVARASGPAAGALSSLSLPSPSTKYGNGKFGIGLRVIIRSRERCSGSCIVGTKQLASYRCYLIWW